MSEYNAQFGKASRAHVDTSEPTTQDLILLELRDLLASVGEIRLAVGALMERVERLENRCACDDAEMRKTVVGTIQGLDGEWTVTPPPEFGA